MHINKLSQKNKLVIVSCYDSTFAKWLEKYKCDALLVGDSLGIYVNGSNSTKNVHIKDIEYHTRAVKSGVKSIPIIADMPYGSFTSKKIAKKNALKLIDAGADMVKIEGDIEVYHIIDHLTNCNIKVCGHIGYTPQTKEIPQKKYSAIDLLAKAKSIEACGASMLVLSMTGKLADELITKNISIPTIGFRSSLKCDGAVEILHDLIGISENKYVFKKFKVSNINESPKASLLNFIKKIRESL